MWGELELNLLITGWENGYLINHHKEGLLSYNTHRFKEHCMPNNGLKKKVDTKNNSSLIANMMHTTSLRCKVCKYWQRRCVFYKFVFFYFSALVFKAGYNCIRIVLVRLYCNVAIISARVVLDPHFSLETFWNIYWISQVPSGSHNNVKYTSFLFFSNHREIEHLVPRKSSLKK